MRALALLCLLGCTELRLPPTFPRDAAEGPVIDEQALLGLDADGDAAVAELVDADAEAPTLVLLRFDRQGAPTRTLLSAPPALAAAVAARLRGSASAQAPLLAPLVDALWPEARSRAEALGFFRSEPALPSPDRRYRVEGAQATGALPLVLRLDQSADAPQSLLLLLAEDKGPLDEVELARMPLAGDPVVPHLYLGDGTAWLQAGSVLRGSPLHRAVGVRRGSLRRGEAQLHNAHGLADYAAGDLDAAGREFSRAQGADPGFVDGFYNGAAAAALEGRIEDAVGLLRRAAAVDPARVQVLGRDDEDLAVLRRRADVRALLGLSRPPPVDVPPPP